MNLPKIVTLNIGLPAKCKFPDGSVKLTSFYKKPVEKKVFLNPLGFEGDASANRKVHGGMDKAVCVYCHDHYAYWNAELSAELGFSAFGENLSVSNLNEKEVCIGDIFQIGEAQVQITQPRQPCAILNKAFNRQEMACRVQKTGFSGFYVRVIQPGWVSPEDLLQRIQEAPEELSVEMANQAMHGAHSKDQDKIREVLAVSALSGDWRIAFEKRLAKFEE